MAKGEKKNNSKFKYFVVFILFIGVGVGLGIFGTTKFLEYKKDNEQKPVINNEPVDITANSKYVELIQSLRGMLNGNTMFYSTKGVVASSLDNTSRLKLLYDYAINNNLSTNDSLDIDYYGGATCKSGVFIVDRHIDTSLAATSKCSVIRISLENLKSLNNKFFNDNILDTSVGFNVGVDKKCVVDGDSYICGNVTNISGYTGELESKFEILKVNKLYDGTIEIYEKGYLIDKRSNVDNPTDQYDNYYLHSSDSKDYYYELKSADNLTFKHSFKTVDNKNYYYVSTELVKE